MEKILKKNSSFTLIELLVVIVIIGILAGVVTIATTSFINNSRNTRMVAELSSMSKQLMGFESYPRGSFCLEDDKANEQMRLFLKTDKLPTHPLYKAGDTASDTNNCFLYYSDGEHYSIRVPTVGNKGYLIQESRHPEVKEIQKICDEGWIPFGNRCVMKYEASNTKTTPKSESGKAPLVSVTREEAKTACENINAHLMTNAEWMAIARDIEEGDNWANNVLNRGNFSSVAVEVANAKDDQAGSGDDKRTHNLSNGQIIWDFSGNVWEWVDEVRTGAEMTSDFAAFTGWKEYTEPNLFKNATKLPEAMVSPVGSLKTAANGVGKINIVKGADSHPLRRGGDCKSSTTSTDDTYQSGGVFALCTNTSPTTSADTTGFRCVK